MAYMVGKIGFRLGQAGPLPIPGLKGSGVLGDADGLAGPSAAKLAKCRELLRSG